jgi:hypothetical protein
MRIEREKLKEDAAARKKRIEEQVNLHRGFLNESKTIFFRCPEKFCKSTVFLICFCNLVKGGNN